LQHSLYEQAARDRQKSAGWVMGHHLSQRTSGLLLPERRQEWMRCQIDLDEISR
jgi:hypothetical protein